MLNKISVSLLLKAALGVMAAMAIVTLSIDSVISWQRYQNTQRDFKVAEVSSPIFVAQHSVRLDRSATYRDLLADKAVGTSPLIRDVRAREIAALNHAVSLLDGLDIPEATDDFKALRDAVAQLPALHAQTDAALSQPKSQRPAGLDKELSTRLASLSALLDRISDTLSKSIRLDDPLIDQIFLIKDFAWIARNTGGGDGSVMISNAVNGVPMPPDTVQRYTAEMAKAQVAWDAVTSLMSGLNAPPALVEAKKLADSEFFSPDYMALRLRMLTKGLAKQPLEMPAEQWLPSSVKKNTTLLAVAEAALEYARSYTAEQGARAGRALFLQVTFLLLAALLSALLMLMVSRRIINPLVLIRDAMVGVASGDFKTSMADTGRSDEIGNIVASVNAMIERVGATVAAVKVSVSEVTSASGEIAVATSDLSQRTEEQASSLEETTSSMTQIASTVRKNAASARKAQESAAATQQIADRGGEVAGRAVEAMSQIEESAGKIADIIGVIDEIARQTNLLALNAAVEAARAGEAGRGFAVVASEVRSLAQRSSQAAKDIAMLIMTSGSQVRNGVDLVNEAGAALNQIVESIREVARTFAGIAEASADQAIAIEEITKGLAQMDDATQRNSALVEENAATAQNLESQARMMNDQVSFFQVDEGAVAGTTAPVSVQEPSSQSQLKPRQKAAA
jgi:methyl-accepting chemotaxis protein